MYVIFISARKKDKSQISQTIENSQQCTNEVSKRQVKNKDNQKRYIYISKQQPSKKYIPTFMYLT